MTFIRTKARVLELSITPGNGPFALAGPPDNSYNAFSSCMAVGDTIHVTVIEPGVGFWSGLAVYSDTDELTLSVVEEVRGSFGSGSKEILASPLASSSALPFDISGAIVTGGTSSAFTVASFRKYGTLAELDGNIIAFTPHATNAQGATISIDGLTAKPIRLSPGVGLESGVIIAGSPYVGLYNHADGAVYLQGMGGNAYGIPLGAGMDYWLPTTPSSAFAFPSGQAISRTTYSRLFAAMGTTYGAGDGSTTFNLPDKRGRVSAMVESVASRLTAAASGVDGATMGAAGGAQTKTLITSNLPAYTPAGTVTGSIDGNSLKANMRTTSTSGANDAGVLSMAANGGTNLGQVAISGGGGTITGSLIGTPQGGTSDPVAVVQPTIVTGYILRVL